MVCCLALCSLSTAVLTCALVGDTFTLENLTYTVLTESSSTGTVSVKNSSTNISGILNIPVSVKNGTVTYKVKKIEDYGFQYCGNLTSVVIPEDVDYIGWEAFADCGNLKDIKLPEGGFVMISTYAFNRSGLQSLYIPMNTYWNPCQFTGYANGCDELRSVTVHPENPYLCSIDGVMYSKDKTIICLYPAKRSGTSYEIPNTVETIFQNAFSGARYLKEIVIPDSVTIIKDLAFRDCTGLKSIIVPDRVMALGHNGNGSIFDGCTSLESVTLGRSLETIKSYAFYGCTNLKSVYYKGNAPRVGEYIYGWTPSSLISYYPEGNSSWKSAIRNGQWQDRGTATWNPPVPPKVSYKQKNNTLTLTFTGTLQESTDCKKWTTVSGTQGTYTVKTGKNKKFYRCAQ